jgi:predicted ribosome quality control (RQC) complex YloA/Tae2 family protein
MDHYQSSFTVRAISRLLSEKLPGYFLTESFSTGKDELLLEFEARGKQFNLKLNWADGQLFISMPEQSGNSGKNTINQFRDAVGKQVAKVHDSGFDRSFRIEFSDYSHLVFKCWGKHSNVLFYEAGSEVCSQHFRLHHKGDAQLPFSNFTGQRDFVYDPASCSDPEMFREAYPFVVPSLLDYLLKQGFFRLNESARKEAFREFRAQLEQPRWYIGETEGIPFFSFFPVPGAWALSSLQEALNLYVKSFLSQFHLRSRRQQLRGFWQQEAVRLGRMLEELLKEQKRLLERPGYRLMGDLIMANLELITEGLKEITLPDFSGQQRIIIKLNSTLSAVQNAEAFYRKAKNESKEAELVASRLATTLDGHRQATHWLAVLDAALQSKDLRNIPLPEKKGKAQHSDLPFHEFNLQGYVVWVGKHAKANELLLNSYSRKNDVWLHARDVSGSHVLIRTVHGTQGLPKAVLEQAAALAAWFSKGKTQGWLPVQYTERKYVRKRKGGAPGEVLVEKEKVLIVQPGLPG